MNSFRQIIKFFAAVCVLSFSSTGVHASQYPERPIRLIVPFPAAGGTDIFARALSNSLSTDLGVPIVVENRPGAGGSIGSKAVASADADGYTILFATASTHAVAPNLGIPLPYDVEEDFTPIAQVGSTASVMIVPESSPVSTLKEWIAYANTVPDQLNYGSSGNGTSVHLTTEYFLQESDLSVVHVPYRGTGMAIADLIAGQIHMMIDAMPTALPLIRDGRVKALGVTSTTPSSLLPEVPPMANDLPGFESSTWFGLYGPKGLSPEIVTKLNASVNKIMKQEELLSRLVQLGIQPSTGSTDEFIKMVKADSQKWKSLIRDRKLEVSQ
jgi:tripartite-type tricarboxylate transporter receptor subunit TctC